MQKSDRFFHRGKSKLPNSYVRYGTIADIDEIIVFPIKPATKCEQLYIIPGKTNAIDLFLLVNAIPTLKRVNIAPNIAECNMNKATYNVFE